MRPPLTSPDDRFPQRQRPDASLGGGLGLDRVAKGQRLVLAALGVAIVVNLVVNPILTRLFGVEAGPDQGIASPAMLLQIALYLASVLFQVAAVFTLSRALEHRAAWLWASFMLVPILGLAVLLALNFQATAALRAGGYQVGLFGATRGSR